MLAYLSRTDIAIKQLEKLSWDWIKMDCSGGKCYGLLAVSGTSERNQFNAKLLLGSSLLLCLGALPSPAVGIFDWCDVNEDEAGSNTKRVSFIDDAPHSN